ncbi:MAG: lysophospholipase, partial [Cyanobacteria bacterium]|nr:lysophospholipase [Cyanobacteriota bacterium]
FVKENKPASVAEYFWLSSEFRMRTLPIIEWQTGIAPKAALLCIHGLGLDNTAFTTFGQEMSKRGFAVYALDVRGFGSWLSIPGEEDAQFSKVLEDVEAMVQLINERNPNLPIFLVGESMGGGIALRAGSQLEGSINGIIASVPSAEQFQQRRMTLSVASHFLRGPDRPFDIGHTVTAKATTNEDFQKAWEESFKAKMRMTPIELMKFSVFMRTTQHHCRDIDETPVFIVQGLKDRLVKPEGSYKMFDSVTADDKTMMIIGTAEHLIFESEKQTDLVINTITPWMEQRLDSRKPKVDALEAQTNPRHHFPHLPHPLRKDKNHEVEETLETSDPS